MLGLSESGSCWESQVRDVVGQRILGSSFILKSVGEISAQA